MDGRVKKEIHRSDPLAVVWPGERFRFNLEYVRNGTATLCIAFKPLGGVPKVDVTESCTRRGWAGYIKGLVDGPYLGVARIVLVMDQ